jgi:hypothetical protein
MVGSRFAEIAGLISTQKTVLLQGLVVPMTHQVQPVIHVKDAVSARYYQYFQPASEKKFFFPFMVVIYSVSICPCID